MNTQSRPRPVRPLRWLARSLWAGVVVISAFRLVGGAAPLLPLITLGASLAWLVLDVGEHGLLRRR